MRPQLRWRLWMQNGVFVVLLAAFVALLAFFAHEYRFERDMTQNARHTVSQPAHDVLERLPGAIQITVFAAEQDERGNPRQRAREFLAPYQRIKPDIAVMFVDPRSDPKRTQDAGVRIPGELVIAYNQKTEHLTSYSEQGLINALMRLARAGEHWVMVLEGHGERRINGIANHDLGEFGKQLASKGFKATGLNLAIAQEVPANASLLVIASPQVDLQAGEVEKISAWLKKGGSLLWLIDPEPLHGLQPIAEQLGLVLGPGTIVDPDATRFKVSPAMALAANYGRHPITDSFRLNTVFPFARQIGVNSDGDSSEWHATPLVEVAPRGWVETGKLDTQLRFDKARDVPGPVPVAYALDREVEDHVQRVVVVGNGSFLANTFVGNGGNLDLGINMINWLTGDDNLITLQPRPTVDGSLELGTTAQLIMFYGFLILLPLTFAGFGFAIWWRRRKA